MTVRDTLVAARTLIAEGWTQGEYWTVIDGCKCYCPIGALTFASDGYPAAFTAAWQLLSRAINDKFLVRWNDRPERTQAEVLAAFDRAIALAS